MCTCVCTHACTCTYTMASMWRSENNSQESVLYYHPVGSGWGAEWGHPACVQASLPTKPPCQPLGALPSLFHRNGDNVSHSSPVWLWIGRNLPTSAFWALGYKNEPSCPIQESLGSLNTLIKVENAALHSLPPGGSTIISLSTQCLKNQGFHVNLILAN